MQEIKLIGFWIRLWYIFESSISDQDITVYIHVVNVAYDHFSEYFQPGAVWLSLLTLQEGFLLLTQCESEESHADCRVHRDSLASALKEQGHFGLP